MTTGHALIAAGGTAGHVFPAVSTALRLVERGWSVDFVTDPRGHRLLPSALTDLATIHILPAPSRMAGSAPLLRRLLVLAVGLPYAWASILSMPSRPDVLVAFGGYACLPVALAGFLCRIPILVHEQNAILGRANRLLLFVADRLALGMPISARRPLLGLAGERVIVTGNPLRRAVQLAAEHPLQQVADGKRRILIMGGSLGATVFSRLIPDALAMLSAEERALIELRQQCRDDDMAGLTERYRALGIAHELHEFFVDAPVLMRQAHLIVARAGAVTVSEILALDRPALLLPYPGAMDDHQRENAEYAASQRGIVRVLRQLPGGAAEVAQEITRSLADPAWAGDPTAKRLHPDPMRADEILCDVIAECATRRKN